MRRADLEDVQRRFRRIQRRRRLRRQARLDWRVPGAVWAADFKEPREPLEGRYGAILSIKDLASRCQLTWLPVEEATAATVQAEYQRLIEEHGAPLVIKSDNGGPFREVGTKALLAEHQVVPLYNPKRRPSYNGGVERANGQLAGYQEAQAEFRGRAGLPTREDAESALRLANDLARRDGRRGPTAGELWRARAPITVDARAAFLATVDACRVDVRAQWNFAPDEPLKHYPQAAVDRRAVRDALVSHDLLRILPRKARRAPRAAPLPAEPAPREACVTAAPTGVENLAPAMLSSERPGRIELCEVASSAFGEARHSAAATADGVQPSPEEATSSTQKTTASGQHYG
jgi:transposase InsO family protein